MWMSGSSRGRRSGNSCSWEEKLRRDKKDCFLVSWSLCHLVSWSPGNSYCGGAARTWGRRVARRLCRKRPDRSRCSQNLPFTIVFLIFNHYLSLLVLVVVCQTDQDNHKTKIFIKAFLPNMLLDMIFIFIAEYYLWEWTSAYKWMIDSFAVCQRQQTAHKSFGINIVDANICRQRRMKRLRYESSIPTSQELKNNKEGILDEKIDFRPSSQSPCWQGRWSIQCSLKKEIDDILGSVSFVVEIAENKIAVSNHQRHR